MTSQSSQQAPIILVQNWDNEWKCTSNRNQRSLGILFVIFTLCALIALGTSCIFYEQELNDPFFFKIFLTFAPLSGVTFFVYQRYKRSHHRPKQIEFEGQWIKIEGQRIHIKYLRSVFLIRIVYAYKSRRVAVFHFGMTFHSNKSIPQEIVNFLMAFGKYPSFSLAAYDYERKFINVLMQRAESARAHARQL